MESTEKPEMETYENIVKKHDTNHGHMEAPIKCNLSWSFDKYGNQNFVQKICIQGLKVHL